mgnify:CR=1 FL=1
MEEARQIRDFWFGKVPLTPETLKRRMQLWFGGAESADVLRHRDELIRSKFAPLIERAASGELSNWADGPRRRLSLIVLLDQFPRKETEIGRRLEAAAPELRAIPQRTIEEAALTRERDLALSHAVVEHRHPPPRHQERVQRGVRLPHIVQDLRMKALR